MLQLIKPSAIRSVSGGAGIQGRRGVIYQTEDEDPSRLFYWDGERHVLLSQPRVWHVDPRLFTIGGNVTADVQALIDQASAAYSAEAGAVLLAFPPGVLTLDYLYWRENLIYGFGRCRLRQSLTQANPGTVFLKSQRYTTNGSYYGHNRNITIVGGIVESNGYGGSNPSLGAQIVQCDEFEDGLIDGLTVVHAAGRANWALRVSGRRVRLVNPQVLGGSQLYQDALHITHGKDISSVGGRLESGDDAIALGMDIVGASELYDDEALDGVTVTGAQVSSSHGMAVKVYYGLDTIAAGGSLRRQVRNADISVVGSSGRLRNGGIALLDGTTSGASSGMIESIRIKATLRTGEGGASHDGVNAYGVQVAVGKKVEIDATLTMTDTSGGATRFRPLMVHNGQDITVSIKQNGVVGLPSLVAPNYHASHVITDLKIKDGAILGATALSALQIIPSLGTIGRIVVRNNTIGEIADSMYGIELGATGSIASLRIDGNVFLKKAGAASTRAYATGGATVGNLRFTNNDISDLSAFSLGNFNTTHAHYRISDNIGLASKTGGTVTIASGGVSADVTHGATPRLADTSTAGISQVQVRQTNAPTSAIKWHLSIPGDTQFTINTTDPGASGATFVWSVDTGAKG